MWNSGRDIIQRNYLIFSSDTIGTLIMDSNNFSSSLVPFSGPLFALFETAAIMAAISQFGYLAFLCATKQLKYFTYKEVS